MPDLELKRIQPNRLNPRLRFSKAGLDELAASIKQYGVLEPLVVRPVDGYYEVVVGERRYRAAQQAGLETVPVVVRDYSDEEVMEINLVENVQREDLSAVEKARLCRELRGRWPDRYPTWEHMARRIGVEATTVRTWMRTLGLPEEIQERIAPRDAQRVPEGRIDYQTALRIAEKVKDPERQVELAERLAAEKVPQRLAQEVISRAATAPDREVGQLIEQVAREARPTLAFSHRHYKAILEGHKTQLTRRRPEPDLRAGVVVRAAVTHFADLEIVEVERKRLGAFTAEDAEREGGYTLDELKTRWERQYGAWDPDDAVYLIRFRVDRVL
ncbi:MAG: ParB/RepB/Spo0J family partition protein [Chloroflexi bacterium]|nr:ParB/RepB/Spo0J family partition protein [Chloroflexota bacterium]